MSLMKDIIVSMCILICIVSWALCGAYYSMGDLRDASDEFIMEFVHRLFCVTFAAALVASVAL